MSTSLLSADSFQQKKAPEDSEAKFINRISTFHYATWESASGVWL